MRKALVLVLAYTASAACTSILGDFTAGSSTGGPEAGPDSTSPEASPGDDSGPGDSGGDSSEGGAVVKATSVPVGGSVYLGQTATVSGTQSTPTTAQGAQYLWTLVKSPDSSKITNSNLTGASNPTATFTPDVVGEYDLTLKVSAVGSSQTNSTKVFAVLPQVLFAQGQITDAGSSAFYAVADFDGGNTHPVVCPDTAVTPVPNEIATFAAYAGRAYDFWEAPAGEPSRLAGFMMDYVGGGYSTHLYTTSTAATCQGGVTDLASTTFGPGAPYGSSPHFSPDGSRFAVYDRKWNIVTYPSTGSTPVNTVAPYPLQYQSTTSSGSNDLDPTGTSGFSANGYVEEPPRIEWIAASNPLGGGDAGTAYDLAWALPMTLPGGGAGWTIVTAPDHNGAQPSPYMGCPGLLPREIAILADGSVIASYRQDAASPEDIVHLTVSAGKCVRTMNYTNLPPTSSGVATDFAVSPDGARLAYLRLDPTTQDAGAWQFDAGQLPGGYVYVVPIAPGAGMPQQVSPAPALYGPRWIGGGGWLVFTRLDGVTGGGALGAGGTVASSVVIVPAAGGGPPSVVTSGDGVTSFAATSGSGACSAAPGTSRSAWAGLGLLGAVASLRRFRRRSGR